VLANMIVPADLVLKVGAQVMLVRNIDDRRGLVNGSVGRVRAFFAAPAGKADQVVRDLDLDAEGKPIYTKAEPKVEGGKENKKPRSSGGLSDEKFPYVEFATPMGKVTVLVTRDEFKVEDNEGNVIARRVQVPLILAWAISIHKSQGQTIQRVKIDLSRVFEKGDPCRVYFWLGSG
jgi:ATP-dependent DNA helicase PIF1